MDVAVLRNRIQSTLDPNADIRRQVELDLRYVCSRLSIIRPTTTDLTRALKAENQPGFTSALLDILQAEQDNGVRLSSMSHH